MQIVALVQAEDHVCCRYRITAYEPYFNELGYTLQLQSIPKDLLKRLRLFRTLRQADVIILQRHLFSLMELRFLRRYAKRLLFDFDDAIYFRDSYSPKGHESRRRMNRFRHTVRLCDGIICGNPYLERMAKTQVPQAQTSIIPTCVEPRRYPHQAFEDVADKPLTLVWLGSSSTLRGLESQAALWDSIAEAVPKVRMKIICDRFPKLTKMPVLEVPWTEATEAVELADADIGIGWVPDDPWSAGKCGLKLLQYQAAGLPVVANPVGVQGSMIQHGESGYLANTAEEWVNAIQNLAASQELRHRFGQAGHQHFLQHYSVAVGGQLWQNVLLRLLPLRNSE